MPQAKTEWLTQHDAASRLGITRYMVRKLEASGLPREEEGYPWPAVLEWYREYAAGEPTSLSQKDAAEQLGISTRQLRNLDESGVPRTADGDYPWPEVRDWYVEFKQREAVERTMGGNGNGNSTAAAYYAARARKEAALADLREMEVQERRGHLLHIDDLVELFSAPLDRLRAQLLALPGTVAPKLADRELPIGEIATVLRDEVHHFLDSLADDIPFQAPDAQAPDPAAEHLTQKGACTRLGISRYMIRKLEEEGLPREDDGYPWPTIAEWYDRHVDAE